MKLVRKEMGAEEYNCYEREWYHKNKIVKKGINITGIKKIGKERIS